jgi:hypothetical protein
MKRSLSVMAALGMALLISAPSLANDPANVYYNPIPTEDVTGIECKSTDDSISVKLNKKQGGDWRVAVFKSNLLIQKFAATVPLADPAPGDGLEVRGFHFWGDANRQVSVLQKQLSKSSRSRFGPLGGKLKFKDGSSLREVEIQCTKLELTLLSREIPGEGNPGPDSH